MSYYSRAQIEEDPQIPEQAIKDAQEFLEREWLDNGQVEGLMCSEPYAEDEKEALEILGEQYKELIQEQARELYLEHPERYFDEPEEHPYHHSAWEIP